MENSHAINRPPYEVFLSFRVPDMRNDFADRLYAMLTDAGISVFTDKEEQEKHGEIPPELIRAIEQSEISLPIISMDYGRSESCLRKLEQMLKCMDKESHIIIPIFYYVDQSDVRNSRGPFLRSLAGHKKRDAGGSLVNSWKSVLRRIGQLKGHILPKTHEGSHVKLIEQIAHRVLQKLKKEDLHLVGVDPHVECIMAKLNVVCNNGHALKIDHSCKKVLGIYGMTGVGKTVLAKYVCDQLRHLFDAYSFLGEIQAEIKRHGILSLQNKLITDLQEGNYPVIDRSDKALYYIQNRFCTLKILVFLDDVKDHEQLSTIVGELDWLGPGSRVILTSRRQDVLRSISGAESFVLGLMAQDEALKLFCRHAFRTNSPREEFENLSKDIVAATGGLPLVLTVVGSSLFHVKSIEAWKETLEALEKAPHKSVQAALEQRPNI